MNIYVGNLSYDVTDDDLRSGFEQFGEVSSASVIMDRETGRSKGFGFVEMAQNDQGLAAIEGMNDKDLCGRKIRVNEARPKEARPRRSGGGGGGGGGRGGYGGGGGGYGGGGGGYGGGSGGGNRRW